MELDILKNRPLSSGEAAVKIRVYFPGEGDFSDPTFVPGDGGKPCWLLHLRIWQELLEK